MESVQRLPGAVLLVALRWFTRGMVARAGLRVGRSQSEGTAVELEARKQPWTGRRYMHEHDLQLGRAPADECQTAPVTRTLAGDYVRMTAGNLFEAFAFKSQAAPNSGNVGKIYSGTTVDPISVTPRYEMLRWLLNAMAKVRRMKRPTKHMVRSLLLCTSQPVCTALQRRVTAARESAKAPTSLNNQLHQVCTLRANAVLI